MHGCGGRKSQVLADMGDTPTEEEERGPRGTRFDGIWIPLFAVKEAPRVGTHEYSDWGGSSRRWQFEGQFLAAYCTAYSVPSWELEELDVSYLQSNSPSDFGCYCKSEFFHRPCFFDLVPLYNVLYCKAHRVEPSTHLDQPGAPHNLFRPHSEHILAANAIQEASLYYSHWDRTVIHVGARPGANVINMCKNGCYQPAFVMDRKSTVKRLAKRVVPYTSCCMGVNALVSYGIDIRGGQVAFGIRTVSKL